MCVVCVWGRGRVSRRKNYKGRMFSSSRGTHSCMLICLRIKKGNVNLIALGSLRKGP